MNTLVEGSSALTPISRLQLGQKARVRDIKGGRRMIQRVGMLGIRPGADIRVVHGPGSRGAVVQVGGARIALGQTVVETILVEPQIDTTEVVAEQEVRR